MKRNIPKIENEQVAILRDGKDSPFWKTLKRILQNEKDEINQTVMQKEELALTDKQVDDLIRWYNFLDYVVNLPQKCIETLENTPVNDGTEAKSKQDSNDPYPIAEVREKIMHQ